MGFTLNLTFGGLCLYVPDLASGSLRMHALLPSCAHVPHHPRLVYDLAARTGWPPTSAAELVPLDNSEIDLTTLAAAPPVLAPPPEVPNLTQIFPRYDVRVNRAFLDNPNTGGVVNARIRFEAGRPAVTRCGIGGHWFFPTPDPPSMQLPIQVVWRLEISTPSLKLDIKGINGSTASTPLELHPDPARNELDVWVLNSPQLPSQFPPPNSATVPDPLEAATHIACFYHLTDTPGLAVPLFDQPDQTPGDCFVSRQSDPGLDLVCIGAVAMPRP